MNKSIAIIAALLLNIAAAHAMSGAPVFCIGEKMTGMTVEATQSMMKLNSTGGGQSESFMTQRVMLTARYGLMPNVDCSGQLGTSNLSFRKLPAGFSEYTSEWAFAWGAGIRMGYPDRAFPFQVVGALNYFGFQPTGKTANGTKSISSTYLWHEVTPTITAGYAVGAVVPFVGLAKPYLFGNKDVEVGFNGQSVSAAGGKLSYSDGQQSVRGIFGLEWKWPDGYSVTAEAAAAAGGLWTFSIGVAQVLK